MTTCPINNRLTKKQLAALTSGNIIEYYDYVVYGLLTPVLSALFFPAEDRFISLLQAFAAFATTMLARPVGSVVIGIIGDLTGRKNALVISSFITGLGTLSIGFLPDTASIGTTATILLIAMRLLQGFGMSSEFCSVLVVTGEMAKPERRGIITSLAHSSGMLGTLIASVIVTLIYMLPEESLYSWGWRIPFWLGGLTCLIAWFIRRNLPEQPSSGGFKKLKQKLAGNWISLVRLFFVVAGNTLLYHLLFVFFSTYLMEVCCFSAKTSTLINSINLIALVIFCVMGGWMGDRYGRKRTYLCSLITMTAAATPTFWVMSLGNDVYCCLAQTLLAFLTGIIMGVSSALYTEMLPTGIRMTGTTVPYNMAILIFGGTGPLITLALREITGFSNSRTLNDKLIIHRSGQ